ncbi:CopG family transcriptional regulator [Acidisphaera sp. L21]|jgi:Arc/MetJ-type ribon-helix-helix transcriptional regulator|uniref:CopG family transcriptional regulator n=1 Tax=Acidisphaera sp. L21 TaxID=1641851 RepID=UPI00131C66D9|nr:CopG family transcriptional regulator [Acidisphaera sp. L21]
MSDEAKSTFGRASGGHARAEALSPERRREIAQEAARKRWRTDLAGRSASVRKVKADLGEKLAVNVPYVDLGHIDLLVSEGIYASRDELIRTAIRNQLDKHAEVVRQSVVRHSLDLGLRHLDRRTLEEVRNAGERLELKVLGLLTIADDVDAALAVETIASIQVLGAMQARPEVRKALADRTR